MVENDLLILEFRSDSGAPVYLDPNQLTAAIGSLEVLLLASVAHASNVDGSPYSSLHATQLKLLVAAVEPGSVKIGLKVQLPDLRDENANKIENAAHIAQVINTGLALLTWAGISLNYFTPMHAPPESEKKVYIEASERFLSNPSNVASIEQSTKTLLQAGADTVIIRTPDAPSCTLVENAASPHHLAMNAQRIDRWYFGQVGGELAYVSEPIEFQTNEGTTLSLALGQLTLDPSQIMALRGEENKTRPDRKQTTVLVLFAWDSRRPPPTAKGEKVIVRGKLNRIDPAMFKATTEITDNHRRVSAFLRVESTQVYE